MSEVSDINMMRLQYNSKYAANVICLDLDVELSRCEMFQIVSFLNITRIVTPLLTQFYFHSNSKSYHNTTNHPKLNV